mgnify:CR=1 FL=1
MVVRAVVDRAAIPGRSTGPGLALLTLQLHRLLVGLAGAGGRIGLGIFDNHPDLFSKDTTGRIGLFNRHGNPAPFGSAQIGIITACRADNTQPDLIIRCLDRNDH